MKQVLGGGVLIGVNPRYDEDARRFESEWRSSNATEVRNKL